MNSLPVAGGATLASAAAAASGVALTNTTTFAAGVAPGTQAVVGGVTLNTAVGLDIVVDKAAAVQGNNVITLAVPANIWRYAKGQWLAVAGAGPAGATLFGQITALGTTVNGQITLSVFAATAAAAAEVGLTNRYSLYDYGNPAPTGVSAMAAGGMGRFLIPECATARGVGVTGVASGVGGPMLIRGIDIFGSLQTEIITAGAGAVTVYGKKCYKVFIDATPQFNDNHAYSVVTSDLIGLPFSVLPNAPPPVVTLAGAAYTTGVFQYADLTNPATTTTGDPRGAIQMSTKGPNAGATGAGPTGTGVLSITQTISALAAVTASVLNPGPLVGVSPV
jgi:hypothetical protein